MLTSNLRNYCTHRANFKDHLSKRKKTSLKITFLISLKDSNKYLAKYFQTSSVNVQLYICSFGCILIRAMVISSSHMHNRAVVFSIFIIYIYIYFFFFTF